MPDNQHALVFFCLGHGKGVLALLQGCLPFPCFSCHRHQASPWGFTYKDMAATGAQSGRMLNRLAHPFTCPFVFHSNKFLLNAYYVPGALLALEQPHVLSEAFYDLPHCSSSHEPHLPFFFPSFLPSIYFFFLSPSLPLSFLPFFSLLCPQTSIWHLWLSFSLSVMSQSGVRPRGLQHTRLPCPSLTPGVCSNSCPSSR